MAKTTIESVFFFNASMLNAFFLVEIDKKCYLCSHD